VVIKLVRRVCEDVNKIVSRQSFKKEKDCEPSMALWMNFIQLLHFNFFIGLHLVH